MFPLRLVVVVFCIVSSSGLLLDGSTKSPQAEKVMSDSQFTNLLTFIFEEQKSREQLENVVQRLKQELTSKGDSFGRIKQDINGLKLVNSVTDLHSVFDLENNTNQLEIKVQNTENSIQTILSSSNARSQDIMGLLNKIKETDNMTLHLENEITKSNDKLSVAVADINSRKQDFIALLSKTEETNNKLKSLEVNIKNQTHYLETNFMNTVSQCQNISSIKKDILNNVEHLHSFNDTLLKLNRISNREIKGNLPGFYLISVYVATDANAVGYYTVYKNNEPIATAYRHPNSYINTVDAIVTERLRTNDTVYIQNGPEIYVRGGYQSCFSIIQIE
ncbi:unnamed protein product [Mytilus coruscus]|uniref:C1q domain-containing protein n=1 Tax=Mytilus coruscus TaxID=42192 RepID=A0A6J8AAU4_MYTCO|nr:unnamed protein product [Mytilus coruscus]